MRWDCIASLPSDATLTTFVPSFFHSIRIHNEREIYAALSRQHYGQENERMMEVGWMARRRAVSRHVGAATLYYGLEWRLVFFMRNV